MTRNSHAFTLLEIVVILAIIAFLAGLITSMSTCTCGSGSKVAAITLELQQLGGALEELKIESGAYPPNLMTENHDSKEHVTSNDAVRFFKKAFPRNEEPESLILALAGETDETGETTWLTGGLRPTEAICFWLGGFSKNPSYPLSGTGGPSFSDQEGNADGILEAKDEQFTDRNLRYEFDLGRLFPKTKAGHFDDRLASNNRGRFLEYDDPRDGTRRRINFWQYAPFRSKVPIVYFDTSRYSPKEYYSSIGEIDSTAVAPLQQLRDGADPGNLTPEDYMFVEAGKFQLLCAGIDNAWGDYSGIRSGEIVAPKGPFIGEIADTLANFTISTLEDIQE